MMWFQILFLVFAGLAAILLASRYRAQELSGTSAIFWLILWGMGTMIVIMPDVASQLANVFGIGRGSDLILYVTIIVLFFLLFKTQIKIEKLNIKLTKLIRHYALEDEANSTEKK